MKSLQEIQQLLADGRPALAARELLSWVRKYEPDYEKEVVQYHSNIKQYELDKGLGLDPPASQLNLARQGLGTLIGELTRKHAPPPDPGSERLDRFFNQLHAIFSPIFGSLFFRALFSALAAGFLLGACQARTENPKTTDEKEAYVREALLGRVKLLEGQEKADKQLVYICDGEILYSYKPSEGPVPFKPKSPTEEQSLLEIAANLSPETYTLGGSFIGAQLLRYGSPNLWKWISGTVNLSRGNWTRALLIVGTLAGVGVGYYYGYRWSRVTVPDCDNALVNEVLATDREWWAVAWSRTIRIKTVIPSDIKKKLELSGAELK